jgi:hypothetical protein
MPTAQQTLAFLNAAPTFNTLIQWNKTARLGIGPAKAKKIIAQRTRLGGFQKIDDLRCDGVSGAVIGILKAGKFSLPVGTNGSRLSANVPPTPSMVSDDSTDSDSEDVAESAYRCYGCDCPLIEGYKFTEILANSDYIQGMEAFQYCEACHEKGKFTMPPDLGFKKLKVTSSNRLDPRFPPVSLPSTVQDGRESCRESGRGSDGGGDSGGEGDGEPSDPNIINLRDLDMKDKLGNGAFGVVYKAWSPALGDVAVKQANPKSRGRQAETLLQNELKMLQDLRHENIVQLYGWNLTDPNGAFYVTQMMDHSLEDVLEEVAGSSGWESKGRLYAKDCAQGIAYLHCQHRIIHSDLSPDNILIKNGAAKLADVGLSKHLCSTQSTTGLGGKFFYIAPEVEHKGRGGLPSDIYSIGVVLCDMFEGCSVFDRGEVKLPEGCSKSLSELIEACLQHNHRARPKAEELTKQLVAMNGAAIFRRTTT